MTSNRAPTGLRAPPHDVGSLSLTSSVLRNAAHKKRWSACFTGRGISTAATRDVKLPVVSEVASNSSPAGTARLCRGRICANPATPQIGT